MTYGNVVGIVRAFCGSSSRRSAEESHKRRRKFNWSV